MQLVALSDASAIDNTVTVETEPEIGDGDIDHLDVLLDQLYGDFLGCRGGATNYVTNIYKGWYWKLSEDGARVMFSDRPIGQGGELFEEEIYFDFIFDSDNSSLLRRYTIICIRDLVRTWAPCKGAYIFETKNKALQT